VKHRASIPFSNGEPGQVGVEWRNSANKIAHNFMLELLHSGSSRSISRVTATTEGSSA
jgi:hypothetical protein